MDRPVRRSASSSRSPSLQRQGDLHADGPTAERGGHTAIDRNAVATWRSAAQRCIAIRRSQRIAQRALRWSFEGEISVEVNARSIGHEPDIGSLQYLSGNEKGLASLQGLDFSSLSGSPTWARTRDLRINRLAVDRPASPHECSLFGVRVSNTSWPFRSKTAPNVPRSPSGYWKHSWPVSHLSD